MTDVHDVVGDPDFGAIEVGCSVYSKSCTDAAGYPLGGVVIDLADDHVIVLPNFAPSKGPDPRRINEDDVDNTPLLVHDRFYTRNAGVAASQIFAWLAKQKDKARSGNSEWAQLATRLLTIRDAGTWTPRATMRYRDWQEACRREQAAEAAS